MKANSPGEDKFMLARFRGYIFGGFCFLLFASASWAQISAIEGDVKGPDGQMVKGAVIVIERQDMKGTYKGAKTDKKGHYIYNGLPFPGTYNVSVYVDNEKKDETKGVRTQVGDPVTVSFDLKQSAAQQQATQQAVASGAATPEQERGMSKEQKEQLEKQKKENDAIMAKNKALNDVFNAGKEALNAKNYDGAIDSFQKGIEMDPNQNVIWANLAEAYVGQAGTKPATDRQPVLEKAAEAYGKAIAIKPDIPGYHNNYGLTLAKLRKFDQAQTELAKAAELDPPNAGHYYFNLGASYVNDGQTGPAEAAFKKAIELSPDYADAHFQYATALSAKLTTEGGKVIAPPGMKEELEKYLELAPTGPNAEAAKSLLQAIGANIETDYSKKGAPKKK
jgi:tetratricopeptide (TPR) repeat protein